ncbi:MAG: sulfotransferase [Bacteroidota bacterium]
MKNLKSEDIYAVLKYGIPKRKATIYSLRNDEFKEFSSPVFFLSTGRTGTKWFSELLKKTKGSLVFHSPTPDLSVQSVYAYYILVKNDFRLEHEQETALKEIFLAAREEQLRYSYKTAKKFIETNNYLTFFAPVLANLFHTAKFVHLHRHPGEFVRSALDRNYFGKEDINAIRRIKPVSEDYYYQWKQFSQLEKSAWLWNETNSFIEKFKSESNSQQIMSVSLNELDVQTVKKVVEFIGVDINEHLIGKKLKSKINVQKVRTTKPYAMWSEIQIKELNGICGDLAEHYGYEL